MKITKKQLRSVIKEAVEGSTATLNWLKIKSIKSPQELLSHMNDKFADDFDEALDSSVFGDVDDIEWLDFEAEQLDGSAYDVYNEFTTEDIWSPGSILRASKGSYIHFRYAIPIALHLIYGFADRDCTGFAYDLDISSSDDLVADFAKIEKTLLSIVDRYEFPPSLKDVITSQLATAEEAAQMDAQYGHKRLR